MHYCNVQSMVFQLQDASLYVTHFPCLQCSKAIIQAGIRHVFYATDYKNDEYAMKLFAQSGVSVQHIPFDERKVDFSGNDKVRTIRRFASLIAELWS